MTINPKNIVVAVNGERRSLAWLIENAAAATDVRVENCAGLTALPELPAARIVQVENCAGLILLNAGKDRRGYQFVGVRICGAWRIIAGCRNLSAAEALWHWSDNPECLALAKNLISQFEAMAREEAVK